MKGNGENICKMLKAWLRNCRSILAFMKKEIKDTKNNKGPSHTLKGRPSYFHKKVHDTNNLKCDSLSLTHISCIKLW